VNVVKGQNPKDCSLLHAPRPRLAMYGMGHPDLAFWKLPLSNSVRPMVENTRLGRVEVSGGSLSVAQLTTHLLWIVPDLTINGKCNRWRRMCSE
jgi:hypothetical protein